MLKTFTERLPKAKTLKIGVFIILVIGLLAGSWWVWTKYDSQAANTKEPEVIVALEPIAPIKNPPSEVVDFTAVDDGKGFDSAKIKEKAKPKTKPAAKSKPAAPANPFADYPTKANGGPTLLQKKQPRKRKVVQAKNPVPKPKTKPRPPSRPKPSATRLALALKAFACEQQAKPVAIAGKPQCLMIGLNGQPTCTPFRRLGGQTYVREYFYYHANDGDKQIVGDACQIAPGYWWAMGKAAIEKNKPS